MGLYRIWCGVHTLGDISAFVNPAGQLLLSRRSKIRMDGVGIVFEFYIAPLQSRRLDLNYSTKMWNHLVLKPLHGNITSEKMSGMFLNSGTIVKNVSKPL